MPVDPDPADKLRQYAHPRTLVTADWLQERLGGNGGAGGAGGVLPDGLVVVESDEDVLLYETGHIPGAVKIDWHTELSDPVTRDYVDGEGFATLMAEKGIARDDTVVFYGDKSNWWAAYALWVFTLFGHPDVRLLDGGRAKWQADGRPMTREKPSRPRTDYPVVERDDAPVRAFRADVADGLGRTPLVDVRSPAEYAGEVLAPPDYPQEGASRAGHIPTARNVPWARAAAEDGTFKPVEELRAIYQEEHGLDPSGDVVAYCRIGERSSHTWYVLRHLLGFDRARNYDGSWTEWGNLVGVPVEKSAEPGEAPPR